MQKHPVPTGTSYQNTSVTITYYGSVVGMIFCLGFVLFYGFSGYPPILVAMNGLAGLVSLGGFLILRYSRRTVLAAHLVTLCLYIAFSGPALFTGGINSSSMVWLVLLPVVAALMAGNRASLIWSFIAMTTLICFFMLSYGLHLDMTIHPSSNVDRLTDLMMVMALTMVATWVNERTKKQNMDQLENTQTRLESSNQELEAFVYSVSHDLRAPLRTIDGFSQLLLEDEQVNFSETGKNYLHLIRASTKHMAALIDDLLKLSRVNRDDVTIRPVDLCLLFQEAVKDLRTVHPERRVEVVMPESLVVRGDNNLLRIALNNLVNNAWKFTGKCLDARIEMGSYIQEGKRVIYIKDNGAGFDMAQAEKLFNPFQRLHSRSEFEGTGIGLTIVKRVILRHGGSIWVEANPDEGATFFFTLK